MDSSDPSGMPRVKAETNISAPSTPSATWRDPVVKVEAGIAATATSTSCRDPRDVPIVKVETDFCSDPRDVPIVKVETDFSSDPRDVPILARLKTVEADIAAASTPSASCSDPRDIPILARVKVEADIAAAATTSASNSWNDPRAVPRVKMETDIAAAPKPSVSCNTPRAVPLPRVKAEADTAAAPTQSASGCNMMDCFQSDSSHASKVKIEIDVAEETPLSWTVQDSVQSELSAVSHIDTGHGTVV